MKGFQFDISTGEITMSIEAPDVAGLEAQIWEGRGVVAGLEADGAIHFWDGDALRARPTMPVRGVKEVLKPGEVMRITGVPQGARLIHPGGNSMIYDGFVEWSCPVEGTYYLELSHFPMREVVINVQVRV